jgi:hypothetical protein
MQYPRGQTKANAALSGKISRVYSLSKWADEFTKPNPIIFGRQHSMQYPRGRTKENAAISGKISPSQSCPKTPLGGGRELRLQAQDI